MTKNNKFNLLFILGTIAVAFLCFLGYFYYENNPPMPEVVKYILGIVAIIDASCLWIVAKIVWEAISDGTKTLLGLDKKREKKAQRNLNEKWAAIYHVYGLMKTESSNKNKSEIIKKIIDRIGFSEFDKNMILSNRYHADFRVPEDEQTKKRYLKDWVELMAVNGELSDPEYRFCCDMATKYECSADVIKEIMDEIGITRTSTMKLTDWLKEIETIIYDYCEQTYNSKPNFRIKLNTNFKNNLNFDGLDMVEIGMAIEKKLSLKIPDDHPINHRSANDTDYTVEDLMEALGLIKTTGIAKEDSRYYFYNDRCSFELSREDIKQDNVEKNGLKHTLMTESMLMLIIEIRPCMPQFPSDISMKMTKVCGFECLVAKVGPLATDYNQYFINCGEFVVQVSFTIVSDINKVNSFLNSFRLEK